MLTNSSWPVSYLDMGFLSIALRSDTEKVAGFANARKKDSSVFYHWEKVLTALRPLGPVPSQWAV